MEEELINHLKLLAKRNGIEISCIEGTTTDPDIAFHSEMIVMMNPNYHSSFTKSFRLAHELGHLIKSEHKAAYAFSPYFQNKEERIAHEFAIKVIADYFYEDVPVEHRNWLSFMEEFNLPIWFEFAVRDALYG